jgi:four helix bundle protein
MKCLAAAEAAFIKLESKSQKVKGKMEEGVIDLVEEEQARVYNIRHRCFYFSKSIIAFVRKQKIEKIYYSLFDQLLRSATSIGANVVEGSAGSTNKDFINYHAIALKSANETKYWLCLIRDSLEIQSLEEVEKLVHKANELSRIIATIILNVKARK